jgi:hypothetical protein
MGREGRGPNGRGKEEGNRERNERKVMGWERRRDM